MTVFDQGAPTLLVLTALSQWSSDPYARENHGALSTGHEAVNARAIAPAWLVRVLATTQQVRPLRQ
jgi:hypothetical protein